MEIAGVDGAVSGPPAGGRSAGCSRALRVPVNSRGRDLDSGGQHEEPAFELPRAEDPMSEHPRVLVPVNDSDIAAAALPAARRLSEAAGGAEIELLHVTENGHSKFNSSNFDLSKLE